MAIQHTAYSLLCQQRGTSNDCLPICSQQIKVSKYFPFCQQEWFFCEISVRRINLASAFNCRLHSLAAACQKSNYLRPPTRALLPSVGKNLHFHAFSGVSINSKSFQLRFAAAAVPEFRLFVGASGELPVNQMVRRKNLKLGSRENSW